MIIVRANARNATYISDDLITSGSVGIPVTFNLSEDFDGLSAIAVFEGSGTSRDVALIGDSCVVPHEVVATAGGYLRIGIYAANSEGTIVIPTVWAGSKMILQGAEPSEVDPSAPTPSWVAQVQEAASEALANSEDAIEIAGGADAAAEEARQSASAAAASATAAGQSASAAGTAQEAAEAAQMAAASARDAAVAAQGGAESSAQAAAGSATAAAGSAAAAAASEAAAREVEESIPADYIALSEDVSELKSQIGNIEKPFNLDNLTGNSKLAASVFSAFEIHCADPSADVKLKQVLKQALNVYAIRFSVNGTDYMALNQAISSYTEPAYNSFFINENLYGYYIIDWDALTAGTAYNNINAELKQENIQPLSMVDYIDEPFNIYNLTGNSKLAAGAFSAFEIHCADPSVQVKLTRVLRANSNVHAVIITVNGTTYNALNVLSANYTEPSYNAFNLSNVVYGYFIIDWSKLTSGTAYNSIGAELKQEYIKPYIETPKYQNVEILLPSTINVAVGHEISLEYYNIICCSDIDEYEIQATPSNTSFQNLGDRLRINPASAGNTTVTVSAYKNAVLIATKQTVVHAVADTKPTIKALFLGDSMTNQGIFLAELKRMLGANLNLYGTRSTTAEDSAGNTQTVLNEGRPGWSTSDYVGLASKGEVTNPFYNNGFDFSYYMANNPSFADVTDVFILLGTNDGAGAVVMTNYTAICNSIKNYNSNIRVHCLLPIPNINSGYAWGTRNYNNWLTFKNYMFNTAKKISDEYDGTAGYYIVPVNANINCYYDFPQTEVTVNNRNPQLIAVGNDNVHPSKYGYYRFADVIYGDIIANCQ